MVRSSNGKGMTGFAMRMGVLLLLVASALLSTGCASLTLDDRDIFYSGWKNPNSKPLVQ